MDRPLKRVYLPRTLLDRRRLRRWLHTFEPDAVVGVSCEFGLCPIAEHLKAEFAELGPIGVNAQPRSLWLDTADGNSFTQHTPAWASLFMYRVDRPEGWTWTSRTDRPTPGRKITAAEALTILDGITGV